MDVQRTNSNACNSISWNRFAGITRSVDIELLPSDSDSVRVEEVFDCGEGDTEHDDDDDPFERHIRYSLEQPDDEKDLFASDSEPDKAMDTEIEADVEPEQDAHTNFLSLASSFCRYKEQRIASEMFLDDKFDGDRFLDEHFSEDKFAPDKLSECGMFDRHFRLEAGSTVDRITVDAQYADEAAAVETTPDARSSEDERLVRERRCNYLQFVCSLPKTCSPSICGTLSQSMATKSITTRSSFAVRAAEMFSSDAHEADPAHFDWSIDQLATLRPVDITYNERNHLQYNQFDEDNLTNEKLSKASQEFFSQERIVRSPSTDCRTPARRLAPKTPAISRPTFATAAESIEFQPPTSALTSTPCVANRRLPSTNTATPNHLGRSIRRPNAFQSPAALNHTNRLPFTPITSTCARSKGHQRKKLFDESWPAEMDSWADCDSAHVSQPLDNSVSLAFSEDEEMNDEPSVLPHMENSQCRTPQSRSKKMRSAASCSLNSSLFSRTGDEGRPMSGRHLNLSAWFSSASNEDDDSNHVLRSNPVDAIGKSVECSQSQQHLSNTYDSGCFSQHKKQSSANLSFNCLMDSARHCSMANGARIVGSFNATFSS
jgi:hypothetical protein